MLLQMLDKNNLFITLIVYALSKDVVLTELYFRLTLSLVKIVIQVLTADGTAEILELYQRAIVARSMIFSQLLVTQAIVLALLSTDMYSIDIHTIQPNNTSKSNCHQSIIDEILKAFYYIE